MVVRPWLQTVLKIVIMAATMAAVSSLPGTTCWREMRGKSGGI